MTLRDIEQMDSEFLIPEQVAAVLGCNAYAINVQVRDNPAALGFPTIKLGSRVKIPRLAFIRFMKGELPVGRYGCKDCDGDDLYRQVKAGERFCSSCGRMLPCIAGIEHYV